MLFRLASRSRKIVKTKTEQAVEDIDPHPIIHFFSSRKTGIILSRHNL
jgi:hypothetical protein